MRKLFFYYFITVTIIISCKSQTMDLVIIDFNKDVGEYHLDKLPVFSKWEQKGHWKIIREGENISLELKDNGEKVMNYVFKGDAATNNINYDGLSVEPLLGSSIIVYDNNITFFEVNILHTETFKLYQKLIDKLGIPTEVITNNRQAEIISDRIWDLMQTNMSKYVRKGKDESSGSLNVYYPQVLIWNKKDVIYKLTLEPVDDFISSNLTVITKKAFKDKIIQGYHLAEKDYLLGKYLK